MPPEESPVSSEGSWEAGNPFVGDPGPAPDPDAQQDTPPVTRLRVVEAEWQEGRIRTILRAQGHLTHEAVGVGTEDWVWRDGELEAIAEPAANVMNKVPVLRAAAAVSDELTVGAVMFEYALRSIKERNRVLKAQAARRPPAPVPITGFDAAGERVTPAPPPPDVEWEVPD